MILKLYFFLKIKILKKNKIQLNILGIGFEFGFNFIYYQLFKNIYIFLVVLKF